MSTAPRTDELVLRGSGTSTTERRLREASHGDGGHTAAEGVGSRAWLTEAGEGVWIADLTADAAGRAWLALGSGVKAGFAFPVLVGHEVVAVLEFFSVGAAEPDEELLGVMTNVGTQLGARRRARRLRDQQEELESARAFVANAAHELRTPLATMRSRSQGCSARVVTT